ncbi:MULTISPECIES: hypothetical protein [Brucella/Ochrobactrum group]|uniref:hypothetical protein n=1 Tax=Brucella/Ochrobactrum group TaxID=2826938 RepID=UPI001ADF3E7D|nr:MULTISPECIES: hypothetical protein [Brucella]WHS31498.1 hypothetical protein QLQ09_17120 [Brucella sp. NM4]WHT42039.1 hypothetical protein QLQ11_00315 [Ochrobactrum sp. SSR]
MIPKSCRLFGLDYANAELKLLVAARHGEECNCIDTLDKREASAYIRLEQPGKPRHDPAHQPAASLD